MAVRKIRQDSVKGQSEEYFDNRCSRCESSGKLIEAVSYCCTCDKHFCDACNSLHQEFSGSKGHTVLETSQRDQWGRPQPEVIGDVEKCARHHDQTLTVYCGQHDELCCSVCVSLKHGACEGKTFLPDIAQGVSKSKEIKQVQEDLELMKKEFTSIKDTRIKMRSSLNAVRAESKTKLKALRARIDMTLDSMEEETNQTMTTMFRERNDQIENDIDTCGQRIDEFENIQALFNHKPGTRTDTQIYIAMKRGQEKVLSFREEIHYLTNSITDKLHFFPSETVVDSLKDSGALMEHECISIKLKCTSLKQCNDVNIRASTDKRSCDIQGMCQLLDGSIILSDHRNENIKRLDQNYTVIDTCAMPGKPKRVCRTGVNEIAVALGSKKLVQFVSITDRMRSTSTLRFDQNCSGIAFHRNQLYVTNGWDNTGIYKISRKEGAIIEYVLLKHVRCDQPTSVAVNCSGSRLIIVGKGNGVLVIDNNGNVLRRVTLKYHGKKDISVDGKGNIFISSQLEEKVVQFDDIIKDPVIKVFSTGSMPETVLVDSVHSKLLLQKYNLTGGSDVMNVYNIYYEC